MSLVTYGTDSNGNIYHKVSYKATNEEGVVYVEQPFEHVYIRTSDNKYDRYVMNVDANRFELEQTVDTKVFSEHTDYFHQGWINKNNMDFNGFTYSEINVSELNVEDSVKGLLEELGCKYYSFSKDGSDKFATAAVHPELDIILYYGTNYQWNEYTVEFLVTDFDLNHTTNYADMIQ